MKRKVIKGGREDESEVNISPMIDMVFILLIFFVVTAVFVEEEGFGANSPELSSEEPMESESIVLVLGVDNSIEVDGRRVAIASVTPMVNQLLSGNAEASISIKAHELTNAGFMVRVMDEARLGGADRVTVSSI